MKKEELIDAIGYIDGKYIMEAEYRGKIKIDSAIPLYKYRTWFALTACLCILLLAGAVSGSYWLFISKDSYMGSAEGNEEMAVKNSTLEEEMVTGRAPMESVVQLTQPPTLEAIYYGDGTEVSLRAGSSSWSYQTEDSEWVGVETDAIHPLEQSYDESNTINLTDSVESEQNDIELYFEVEPDRIEILNCWREGASFDDNMAAIESDSSHILVPYTDGNYIYEIVAYWERSDYKGTAYYSIKTEK